MLSQLCSQWQEGGGLRLCIQLYLKKVEFSSGQEIDHFLPIQSVSRPVIRICGKSGLLTISFMSSEVFHCVSLSKPCDRLSFGDQSHLLAQVSGSSRAGYCFSQAFCLVQISAILNTRLRGWREGSVVKSTGCFSIGS